MSEYGFTAEAILGTSVAVWVTVAVVGWGAAILMAYLAARDRAPSTGPKQELGVAQVLRWLLLETDAEAVAYIEVAPGGGERVWVEPRGLDTEAVAELVGRARDALVRSGEPGPEEGVGRWLGAGGSKCIVLSDSAESSVEGLRFARYLLELTRTSSEEGLTRLERKVLAVHGVAWAEETEGVVRALLAEGVSPEDVRPSIEAGLPAGKAVELVEVAGAPTEGPAGPRPTGPTAEMPPSVRLSAGVRPGDPAEERIRLAEVVMNDNGRATADVRVLWKDQELRGRGHGRRSDAGRYFAAAQAVADALRPLLDTDIVVEGLYSASTEAKVPVLIASVRMEGEYFIGAVVEPTDQPGWAGARAVLDAVNRRLTQIAGRSGRI